MIACVVDTVLAKEILNELPKYRLIFLINTKHRATNIYSKVKRSLKNYIEVKINTLDIEVIEKVALGIAKEFANFKEPIHVWVNEKCIVY